MALCCYDEAYTIPTEYAQRISLRTMQLLIEEMGLADTADPLGGSWYVETLTNQMREKMEQVMAEVDAQGGIVKLVSQGVIQARVSAQAYRMQRAIESGEFAKVGVNRYRVDKEAEHEVQMHPYQESDARRQIESLGAVRRERDAKHVTEALTRVRGGAQNGTNVMPAVVEAMKAYATVGEVTHELASVYGRYREPVRF
jgi:methylmalonyl-CoA mutase N-terminal domain/subunit